MHKRFALLAIFIIISAVTHEIRAMGPQEGEGNIRFKWAFGLLVGSGENLRFATITRDTALKTGDKLKMYIELVKECYVYVLHHGPEGEVTLLFPYDLKQFKTDYKVGKNYYIPKGRYWLALDKNIGKETFFLLASPKRLTDVEERLANYMEAKDSRKAEFARDLLTEIRSVRRQGKTLATVAERPISVGGNVRGDGEEKHQDVARIAVQISADDFYSKTFTIDHE